jgi:hypothetical protein
MRRQIRFTFVAENVSAIAELREADAPQTCAAVWEALPIIGTAHHAVYSGSEGVLALSDKLRVPPENATAEVTTGDVGFTWFAPGDSFGVTEEFAELCWFYNQDARPSMPEGPVPVNLFARFIEGSEGFYAVCHRMRREGVKTLLVERVEPPDTDGLRDSARALVYRDRFVIPDRPRLTQLPGGELTLTIPLRARREATGAEGELLTERMTIRSRDGGVTWEPPRPLEESASVSAPALEATAIVELPEGGRLRGFWRGEAPAPAELVVEITRGAGAARQELVLQRVPTPHQEPNLFLFPDGRILCIYRAWDGWPGREPPLPACGVYAASFRLA